MARYDFGGTLADFVVTSHRLGTLDTLALSAATLTMWSAQSGGTRYTDLVLNGSAVSSIAVGADGQVPKFQGPDGITEMWADGGAPRVRVVTLQGAPGPAGKDGANGTPGKDGLPGTNALPADNAVASYVAGPSATLTALAATFPRAGLAAGAQTAVVFGDSIAAQCNDETISQAAGVYDAYSWTDWAQLYLGYRLVVVKNAGIGGNQTGQMLARIDTDVKPYASDWVIMDGGVNDIFDGAGTTLATTQANLAAIFQKITSEYGRKVMMMLPTGSGYGTATTLTNLYKLHRWLKKYAREHRGIYLFDGHGWYCDPADGMPVAGYARPGDAIPANNNRGVHPGFPGAAGIGKALADAMDPLLAPLDDSYLSTNADTLNLMVNHRMQGDGGGGVATSWSFIKNDGSAAAGVTTSKVPMPDGRPGSIQQITWDGSGGSCRLFQQNLDTSKWAAGDVLVPEVRFETDPDTAGSYTMALSLAFWNNLGSTNSLSYRSSDGVLPAGLDVWPRRGIIRAPAAALPSGVGRLQFSFNLPIGTTRIISAGARKVDY